MPCVFCRICAGEIPSTRLYEDHETVVIMDINPANDGHALVIARRHVEMLYDLPDDVGAAMMRTTRRVASAIREALAPEGLNLLQANGPAALQSVPHVHIHVIPRWMNDGHVKWPI